MYESTRGILVMTADRLVRWVLSLSQYNCTVEYHTTKNHGKTNILSRLPLSGNDDFDREEERADVSVVCCIKDRSRQMNPLKPNLLAMDSKERSSDFKDHVLSYYYVTEGWPNTLDEELRRYSAFLVLFERTVQETGMLLNDT